MQQTIPISPPALSEKQPPRVSGTLKAEMRCEKPESSRLDLRCTSSCLPGCQQMYIFQQKRISPILQPPLQTVQAGRQQLQLQGDHDGHPGLSSNPSQVA